MHFLCLHGLGTNSQIFETQTASIRYELDEHHTYDFVEGTEAHEIAPEIKGFYPSNEQYFGYHHDTAETIPKALQQLETYITEEGPFDGVIGFSQGAALAATYLIDKTLHHPSEPLPFRCAIFFSSSPPYDTAALAGGKRIVIDHPAAQALLSIPTTHIWGQQDHLYKPFSQGLASLCSEPLKDFYVHEGGHEIPGARAPNEVQRCVNAINRTIDKASIDQ